MSSVSSLGSAKDLGTSYCFVAGTLVTTEDGSKPIEEIQVGDKVLSEDETTGEVAVKTVTETYVNETDELVHIGVNGETISATPSHPFYVNKFGWTLAGSLRAGDVLVLSNGELVTVEWVQHEILENPIKVYNFEVQDFHTYFVGESGILVHNGKKCGEGNEYTFNKDKDVDMTNGKETLDDALNEAFNRTGVDRNQFEVSKWALDNNGYLQPVECRGLKGAEVSIDTGHTTYGSPNSPHVGYQTPGKRKNGGASRGHIFIDDVPYHRPTEKY